MKFIVTRTSYYGDDNQPCPETKLEKATYICRTTFKSLDQCKEERFKWTEDYNMKKVRGLGIVGYSKEKRDVWVIELNTLEDLLEFQKYHGHIVLNDSYYDEIPLSIEIYDTYRE